MTLRLDGRSRPETLLKTPFNESNGVVSPDGRWLAYQSDESGQVEVYVRPFPNVDAGRFPVSSGGGERPLWSRDGRELFYLDKDRFLTSVPVATTPTFSAGRSTRVLETRYFFSGPGMSGRTYDVSWDGRFLMIKENVAPDGQAARAPEHVVVVLNLVEELKARVRTK